MSRWPWDIDSISRVFSSTACFLSERSRLFQFCMWMSIGLSRWGSLGQRNYWFVPWCQLDYPRQIIACRKRKKDPVWNWRMTGPCFPLRVTGTVTVTLRKCGHRTDCSRGLGYSSQCEKKPWILSQDCIEMRLIAQIRILIEEVWFYSARS